MVFKFVRILFVSVILLILDSSNLVYAQLGPCGPFGSPGVDCDPDNNPDVPVPLDGGTSILIAAGVAYGIKKYRDGKKQSNHNLG